MKTKLLRLLLGTLGFTAMLWSCNTTEYGTPYVNFTMKGRVTDQEQNPVEGIKVSYKTIEYGNPEVSGLSDNKGNYVINNRYMPPPVNDGETFTDVIAEDIDGEENGSFKTQTKSINLGDVVFTGGNGNWLIGYGEKVIDFVLEPADEGGQTPESEKPE